jgi:flagellin
MNELATQAANDTNTSIDRSAIKAEMDELKSEIGRISSTTQFNTMNLLDGSFTGKNLQVGALSGQSIAISISSMSATSLGVNTLTVSTFATAGAAMRKVQSALDAVSTQRSKLGATQNRLEHTIANLDTTSENTSAAESRIRDTDMAKEMVTYSKNQILVQAGQSMLAQANQSTQGVLSLLG